MAASSRAASRATAITSVSVNGGSVAASSAGPCAEVLLNGRTGCGVLARWPVARRRGGTTDGAGGTGRFLSFLVLVRTVRRSRDLRWSCVDLPSLVRVWRSRCEAAWLDTLPQSRARSAPLQEPLLPVVGVERGGRPAPGAESRSRTAAPGRPARYQASPAASTW